MVLLPRLQHINTLLASGRGHLQCHVHRQEKATPNTRSRPPRGAGQSMAVPPATTVQAMKCLGHWFSTHVLLNLLVPQGTQHLFSQVSRGAGWDQAKTLSSNTWRGPVG